jgi:hypothetical protein
MKGHGIITSFCTIRNSLAVVDNNPVFEFQGKGFREFSAALYKNLAIDYPKFHKMDNLCKLGFLSSELLLRNRELRCRYTGNDTGVIFINASSSLDTDRIHQKSILDRSEYFPSPSVFVYTLPNIVIGEICIRNKIRGESAFFIQEKFNPYFLVTWLNYLFDCEIINRCIAGWAEIDGDNYESIVCLIEKTADSIPGIVNFEPAAIYDIYEKIK